MRQLFFLLFIIISALLYPLKAGASTDKDIEKLRKKIIAEVMEPTVDDTYIKELILVLKNDGSWTGIDYVDTTNTGYQHVRHLNNLLQLSRAYKKIGSSYKGKKELKKAIDLSLNYWLEHDFISQNWWHNQLGNPHILTNILLIMDKDLSEEQREKTSLLAGRAHIDAWGARPSGDRIKIAGIQAKNALFNRDTELFEIIIKVIEGEIKFSTDKERGMQYDYSFHHREDRVNNTLTYGLDYANAFAEWAALVKGTRFRFSENSLKQLTDYYLDGICKMMVFGKYPDPGAANREISRSQNGGAFNIITPERLIIASNYRKQELQEIIDIRSDRVKPALSFSTFFWQSDHYTHQRPGYFTSVRMFSNRNRNMEVPYNGEGLMNHHRGDGSNYISLTGTEYFPLSPVYDWPKIPGATILQKESLPSEEEIQKSGTMDFVGAATDGTYGAVGFDFISPHDPLKARKSWFFFDNEYVCLGAGIFSEGNSPIVTTLNQCLLEDEVFIESDGKEKIMANGNHDLNNTKWIFHNGIGYIFPESSNVFLNNQEQTGSWYKINRQTSSSREIVKNDVFKLWIDHGKQAKDESYQYIIMPSSNKEQVKVASENPKVIILINTSDIQAVYHQELHMLQAVFYKNGSITLPDGTEVCMDSPGIILIKNSEENSSQEITVADPLRKLGKIHFSINRKSEDRNDKVKITWDKFKAISKVSVDLPQGQFAGKSISFKL